MKPSESEIRIAADLLVNEYKISPQLINKILGDSGPLQHTEKLIGNHLETIEKAEMVIHQREANLFAGNNTSIRELRQKLISALDDQTINDLFDAYCETQGQSRTHKIRKLSELHWHSGKKWPLTFVKRLKFPSLFAGVAGDGRMPIFEDVDPKYIIPPLVDFQVKLKEDLKAILNEEGDLTRGIISLPTGSGKTRIAVEAFIDWLQPRFSEGIYLIWIAQSEELCEQAIECIKQQWANREFTDSLRIYRYFGSTQLDWSELKGGVLVASINQLAERSKIKEENLGLILLSTGAVIIDEAHRATTSMYKILFDYAEKAKGSKLFPICGLTATPGRSNNQTPLLVNLFTGRLFTPKLDTEYENDPLEYFRKNGYLAYPNHKVIGTNVTVNTQPDLFNNQITVNEEQEIVKRLAVNLKRNKKIINYLLQIPNKTMTIVYACTVQHAYMISMVLNYRGRTASALSSETPRHIRRRLVDQFKKGKIEFLINYGILTTGFDAPKTEEIVICRPIFSEVLYEQIVGRGLRGPQFGGTEYCNIVDFSDNYARFGDQQAFHRFKEFWHSETKELT